LGEIDHFGLPVASVAPMRLWIFGGFGVVGIHPIGRPLRRGDYVGFSGIMTLHKRTQSVPVSVTNIPYNKILVIDRSVKNRARVDRANRQMTESFYGAMFP
jgi:hypothetical protein